MAEWLLDLVGSLGRHPWLQGMLAAFSTFILEDPTTIGCGLLVADGKLAFATALLGVSIGIAVGDLGLYAIGRAVGPKTVSWGLVSRSRIERARRLFERNLISAVLISRFLPGMRLPTYVGAGLFGTSLVRFMAVVVVASLIWTFLLLSATLKFGEAVLPWLGSFKWPAVVVFLLVVVVVQRLASRSLQAAEAEIEGSPVSTFELWPAPLFYFPVAVYYAWLAVRFRSATLPTAVNPSVFSGGVVGESKSQILDLVPAQYRGWVSGYTTLRKDSDDVEQIVERALQSLGDRQLEFPVVAKPDVGQRGAGVRLVANVDELGAYLEGFPTGHRVILQEFVDYPNEAGILYFRLPGESRGRIFSITLKEFPCVIGDGDQTLGDLILKDERARLFREVYFSRHEDRLGWVVPCGEVFQLVFTGNHCKGAVFRNGEALSTLPLEKVVHELFSSLPEFYFGRLDVRFRSVEELADGKGFRIVEINGAAAEATHIWDARTSLREAYSTLFQQFRVLFEIGSINRSRGFRPLSSVKLLKELWAYQRLSKTYPQTL